MKQKFILTFDLEFWYNSKFLRNYLPAKEIIRDDFVTKPTETILDLLKRNDQRATFFVLGQVAEKYPQLIKKIADLGHEIASHGYSHQLLDQLSQEDVKKEIELSKKILKNITGREPGGFRAPNFSITKKNPWVIDILKEQGFRYDSSLSPLKISEKSLDFLKIPSSLGGIYFRILPLNIYTPASKFFAKTKVPVIYLHPHELFSSCPRLEDAPWFKKKIKYWGTKGAWEKFNKLSNQSDFISIEQYLNEKSAV